MERKRWKTPTRGRAEREIKQASLVRLVEEEAMESTACQEKKNQGEEKPRKMRKAEPCNGARRKNRKEGKRRTKESHYEATHLLRLLTNGNSNNRSSCSPAKIHRTKACNREMTTKLEHKGTINGRQDAKKQQENARNRTGPRG